MTKVPSLYIDALFWLLDCVVTFATLAFWTPLSLMHIFLFFPPSSIFAQVQSLPFFSRSTECWPIGCNRNCMNVRLGWQSLKQPMEQHSVDLKKKGPSICRKMLGGEKKWPQKTYLFQGGINWGRPTVKLLFGFGSKAQPSLTLAYSWGGSMVDVEGGLH